MSQINYTGEVTSLVTNDGNTVLTIKGKINQIIAEEMIESTSAFEVRYKDGRVATVTSDRSPLLYNGDGSEAEYDEEEIEDIVRVESAQAANDREILTIVTDMIGSWIGRAEGTFDGGKYQGIGDHRLCIDGPEGAIEVYRQLKMHLRLK